MIVLVDIDIASTPDELLQVTESAIVGLSGMLDDAACNNLTAPVGELLRLTLNLRDAAWKARFLPGRILEPS